MCTRPDPWEAEIGFQQNCPQQVLQKCLWTRSQVAPWCRRSVWRLLRCLAQKSKSGTLHSSRPTLRHLCLQFLPHRPLFTAGRLLLLLVGIVPHQELIKLAVVLLRYEQVYSFKSCPEIQSACHRFRLRLRLVGTCTWVRCRFEFNACSIGSKPHKNSHRLSSPSWAASCFATLLGFSWNSSVFSCFNSTEAWCVSLAQRFYSRIYAFVLPFFLQVVLLSPIWQRILARHADSLTAFFVHGTL